MKKPIASIAPKVSIPVEKKSLKNNQIPKDIVSFKPSEELHTSKSQKKTRSSIDKTYTLPIAKPPKEKPAKKVYIPSQGKLLDLPRNPLHHVLSFLDHRDLTSVGATCKALRKTANDSALWKKLFKNTMGEPPLGVNATKETFKNTLPLKHSTTMKEVVNYRELVALYPNRKNVDVGDICPYANAKEHRFFFFKTISKIKDLKNRISALTGYPENQIGLVFKSFFGSMLYGWTNIEGNQHDEMLLDVLLLNPEHSTHGHPFGYPSLYTTPDWWFRIGYYNLDSKK